MIADRVEETTGTVGLGAYALAGATAGNRRFGAHFANGAAGVRYCAESEDRLVWEIGIGTYNADALARDTVLLSSGGVGAAINWGAGTKRIWSNADAALVDLARTALQPSANLTYVQGAMPTADARGCEQPHLSCSPKWTYSPRAARGLKARSRKRSRFL